ncbi:MAG: family 43 glycosylhydrolase [Clostridia bacterium]|nr:family 43 glycosylhydrolase [Clostridia bacterium]
MKEQLYPVVGNARVTSSDYPDPDVIRVGDTWYMISTTMYFLPGGVLLRSCDLLHWEVCGHVFDRLEDNPAWRLENGTNVYGAGMWAACLRYHAGRFYAVFCANDSGKTYLFCAPDAAGPWERIGTEGFYHDASLLFDDDGRVYIVHGNTQIRLTELKADLSGPRPDGLDRIIADSGKSSFLGYEGSHFYKIGGFYYLFVIHSRKDRWRRVESCLRSDSLTGEFTGRIIFDEDLGYRDAGIAQGPVFDAPDGRWWALWMQDMGAVGRCPVLIPLRWEDGWPVPGPAREQASAFSTRPQYAYAPLAPEKAPFSDRNVWEWNHLPDPQGYSIDGGTLILTARRTSPSLPQTRNILTRRAVFPRTTVHVRLDGSRLRDGDTGGLCCLQEKWRYIGLRREEAELYIVYGQADRPAEKLMVLPAGKTCARLSMDMHFTDGPQDTVYFRAAAGEAKTPVRSAGMTFSLKHFTGNRPGLFLTAEKAAGGIAVFTGFTFLSDQSG